MPPPPIGSARPEGETELGTNVHTDGFCADEWIVITLYKIGLRLVNINAEKKPEKFLARNSIMRKPPIDTKTGAGKHVSGPG